MNFIDGEEVKVKFAQTPENRQQGYTKYNAKAASQKISFNKQLRYFRRKPQFLGKNLLLIG